MLDIRYNCGGLVMYHETDGHNSDNMVVKWGDQEIMRVSMIMMVALVRNDNVALLTGALQMWMIDYEAFGEDGIAEAKRSARMMRKLMMDMVRLWIEQMVNV